MKEKEQNVEKRQKGKQELHIHIERWQDVVNILDDKKRVFLFAFIIVIIGLALFWGISIIIVQLKSSFTYSDITTNALGATQLRDEKKEVSYFLFNTAELWANSGIPVKKGDIISIHASGRGNTAIHHLYDNAKNNKQSLDEFFGANGERVNPESDRDKLRSEYRIFPKLPQSALVMQVVNKDSERKDIPLVPRDGNPNNFYYIGAHSANIHIHNDGILYFAINDIVLDSATIVKMMLDNFVKMIELERESTKKSLYQEIPISTMKEKLLAVSTTKNDTSFIEYTFKEDTIYRRNIPLLNLKSSQLDDLKRYINYLCYSKFKQIYSKYANDDKTFKFGGNQHKNFDQEDESTEMDYYFEHNYQQAWYDDNVGSFLILVEKNYRK